MEVESLLWHHHADTLVDKDRTGLDSGGGRLFGSATQPSRTVVEKLFGGRKLRLFGMAIGSLALAVLAVWTHSGIRLSILELRSQEMSRAIDSIDLAFDIWWAQEQRIAELWAANPRVRELAGELIDVAADGATPDELRRHPAHDEWVRVVEPWGGLAGDQTRKAVGLLDKEGQLIAANYPREVGLRLNSRGLRYLSRAGAGETVFVSPHLPTDLADYEGPDVEPPTSGNGFTYTFVPIRDSGDTVIGVALTGDYAHEEFSEIFKVGYLGNTGEAYAFDNQGKMVSVSRFDEELRQIGLLPIDHWVYPIDVELRDPGILLRPGEPLPEDLAARPLTEPVALGLGRSSAPLGQRRGVIPEPYRSYRGEEVIGAWSWKSLHGLGFGVVVEMQVQEALAPMRHFNFMFGILMLVLVTAGLVALLSTFRSMRLEKELGQMKRLGAYSIERRLGVGGMGEVYLARHARLRRPTAVKIIRPERVSADSLERFEREVQMASQLTHPNTIEIHDFGRAADGTFYYAMEYVEGPDLAEVVATQGPQPAARVLHVLRQVCGALHEAHESGLIHRDIKPQNIMLCERGGEHDVVKVLDFGLVKQVGDSYSLGPDSLEGIRGTPMYMAPERFQTPLDVDARIDIYAVGAVTYELLSARPLFEEGESNLDLLFRAVEQAPRPLRDVVQDQIPAGLEELVMECLAKDRNERPPTAQALLERLDLLADSYPWEQEAASAWWRERSFVG